MISLKELTEAFIYVIWYLVVYPPIDMYVCITPTMYAWPDGLSLLSVAFLRSTTSLRDIKQCLKTDIYNIGIKIVVNWYRA